VELDGTAVARLREYLEALYDANRRASLTSVDPGEAWERHVLESLSLLPLLDDRPGVVASLVDVGSGGGIPGIPIAIARPDLGVTLLEATRKKASFLEEAAGRLGLANVRVVARRAEEAGRDPAHRERHDVAVARAVAPLAVLVELLLPLVRPGGVVLALKGRGARDELRTAATVIEALGGGSCDLAVTLPGSDRQGVTVTVSKASPTPHRYPRRPGIPAKRPLRGSGGAPGAPPA